MLKFLFRATKVVGLTYQLMATSVLIGALAIGTVKHIRDQHKKTD